MEKTLMDPAPFLCTEDGCAALVPELPGYCPAHQGQREYEFEPLPPPAGPATLVRRRRVRQ